MRNVYVGIALVLLLSMPFAASALTIDVQTQINDLLAQIKTLQEKLADLLKLQTTVTTVESAISQSAPHRICAILKRNLSQGASGDDVAGLQEFLQSEGYLSANATGYFGPMTAQAVARWQESQGISAVGALGPLSRERLKIWCGGGGWQNTERFDASPTRGSAPLAVTFSTWLSGFRPQSIYYMIDFGDGYSERAANCYAPSDYCQSPGQNTHTYNSNGTYVATLIYTNDICAGNPACMAPVETKIVGKVQISVGGQACTKEYEPVCASKQIQCVTTPCNPIQQTYGNRCMAEADGATFLYEGACRSDSTNPQNDPRCKSWYDGCNSCSRQSPGGPAMCTLRACVSEMMAKPYCTGYFDSATNKPPVISGFSGPTSLTRNEQGTWKIQATDPENGNLQYAIRWGDEWYANDSMGVTSAAPSIIQATTFTHSYSSAGTYTITIKVSDSSGQSAQASATVSVDSNLVACTLEYAPVCGQPPEPACRHSIPACMMATPGPQTYGNRCQLNAANATFLYEGECRQAISTQ